MFSFHSVFPVFKDAFTTALREALVDVKEDCTFAVDIEGQLYACNNNETCQDEIQEALETMEWGDVQLSDTEDVELDWRIIDCFEQVRITKLLDSEHFQVSVNFIGTDEEKFETSIIEAGYTVPEDEAPTQRKREREEDEDEATESPSKRPDLIDLSADEDEITDLTVDE